MRSIGTVTKWNDDRGFGFITPNQAGEEIFVHISAFPRDGIRPTIGEVISFESIVEQGKTKAVNIIRATKSTQSIKRKAVKKRVTKTESGSGVLKPVMVFLVLLALGYWFFNQYKQSQEIELAEISKNAPRTESQIRQSIRDSLNNNNKAFRPDTNNNSVVNENSSTAATEFKCDGRTHCSQMSSYEEAKFFINNCPGTKMDGDSDGEPCEDQF